jgi:hypothetical protein
MYEKPTLRPQCLFPNDGDTARTIGKRYAVRQDLTIGSTSTSGCPVIQELGSGASRNGHFDGNNYLSK